MNTSRWCTRALTVLLVCSAAVGAETFDERHASTLARNPPGLGLELIVEQRAFRLGERIPVTLRFSNRGNTPAKVWAGSYDRSGRIHDIAFHVDGARESWVDPLQGYFSGGLMGGGLGSEEELGDHEQSFDLNEWVRFDAPGEYLIYASSTRVRTENERPGDVPLVTPLHVCSQLARLTVLPRDEAWEREAADTAARVLLDRKAEQRRRAARTLRFLGTAEAIAILARCISEPELSPEPFFGVIGAPDPAQARAALEGEIHEPDAMIDQRFIDALAHLSVPLPDQSADFLKRHKTLAEARASALERVAEALPRKRGKARALAIALLLDGKKTGARLSAAMAETFEELSRERQAHVLRERWEEARAPEFEDVLERLSRPPAIAAQWHDSSHVPSLALRRYFDLRPDAARQRILEDMRRPTPLFAKDALFALPDAELPEMNEIFAGHLTRREGGDLFKTAALIERYGTAALLPHVIQRLRETDGWACSIQENFLGLWLKHDRAGAIEGTVRAARSRTRTRCYGSVLGMVFAKSYGADAEQAVLPFLADADVSVIRDVAELLARHGSELCIDPLIGTLERLRSDTGLIPYQGWTLEKSCAQTRYEILRFFSGDGRERLSEEQRTRIWQTLSPSERTEHSELR